MGADSEDEGDDGDEAAAEVDKPGFQFGQRGGQLGEQAGGRGDGEESVYSAGRDDVLDASYASPEGVESRRKVAEWEAGGWHQPAGWGRCLGWVAG